jgi:ribosomal protein L12E/L44/L45/RPP1/RPP2
VHKPNDHTLDELIEQIRKQNVTAAAVGRAGATERAAGQPSETDKRKAEEVQSNA